MMRSALTVSRAVMSAWSLKFPLVVAQLFRRSGRARSLPRLPGQRPFPHGSSAAPGAIPHITYIVRPPVTLMAVIVGASEACYEKAWFP